MFRTVATVALAAMLAGIPAHSASATTRPPRSGTIVSGVFATSSAWTCGGVPDCRLWLSHRCDPALATHTRTSWLSAIVDVTALADGTPRTFSIGHGADGIILGGARFQFWTRDCQRIDSLEWRTFDGCPPSATSGASSCEAQYVGRDPMSGPHLQWMRASFPLPREVAWMTITANDNLNLTWTVA